MKNYIKAFLSIFRKKKIEYTGRAGLIYKDDGLRYFIDSEMLVSDDYNIVVYPGSVYLLKGSQKIKVTGSEEKDILERAIKEIENTGVKVLIHTYPNGTDLPT